MARPRKYASEADAKAAKLAKQRQRRATASAATNALKNDPTKRKDAAVNTTYPFAPVNDDTREMIAAILEVAGDFNPQQVFISMGREKLEACITLAAQWEDENRQRLPYLEQDGEPQLWKYMLDGHNGPVESKTLMTYGERWNRLYGTMQFRAHWKKRDEKNKRNDIRRKEKERAEADAAGLTVAELRTSKEVAAKRKWQAETQAAYHRAKGEEALAKRNARIEQESTERMKENEAFGRF